MVSSPIKATTAGPATDADVPGYLASLGLPGLADIHVHFLPEPMLRKVWAYFDNAERSYGRPWPIVYRGTEEERVERLRSLGLRAVPALTYAHKPGMARWLNAWTRNFAGRVEGAIHCGTFYPEPDVGAYVASALAAGARLFKLHVQVGGFSPEDPLLVPAWDLLEAARAPVVIHAGSAPLPGTFTGPDPVRRVLDRHPRLVLVVAHMGMPQFDAFADLTLDFPDVHLDTTMVGTDFANAFAPMPATFVARLPGLSDRVILGSDFPNIPYPYAHQLDALARLELGDAWMRAVLWDNGSRLLGLG